MKYTHIDYRYCSNAVSYVLSTGTTTSNDLYCMVRGATVLVATVVIVPPTTDHLRTQPATHPTPYRQNGCLLHAANDGTEEAVDCVGDSWRYQLANGDWRTEVNFPDPDSTAPATFDGMLFNATADGNFTVSGIPASIAPAVSDSLYGRTIQLDLACNQEDAVDDADACVLFQVNFTNYR